MTRVVEIEGVAYLEVIADFSISEKRQMLYDTAAEIYGL
jgi:hypothetical protein